MADTDKPTEETLVECETCLKEIPASGAQSVETSDYVHYFCGLECYTQWKELKNEEEQ